MGLVSEPGGPLARNATLANQRPAYLFVGQNTDPWSGYEDSGAGPEPGGGRPLPRRLFEVSADG